jgi:hypothetical protein
VSDKGFFRNGVHYPDLIDDLANAFNTKRNFLSNLLQKKGRQLASQNALIFVAKADNGPEVSKSGGWDCFGIRS